MCVIQAIIMYCLMMMGNILHQDFLCLAKRADFFPFLYGLGKGVASSTSMGAGTGFLPLFLNLM